MMQTFLKDNLHISKIIKNNILSTNSKEKKGAIFLDRDGVLILDKHHISDPNKVELESGVHNFIIKTAKLNIKIFIITNQSGIGRGLFNWIDYENVTKKMLGLVPYPNNIYALYASGELPLISNKTRKPNPTMINLACKEYEIDPKKSIFVGDRISDIRASARANLMLSFHISTGKGKQEKKDIKKYIYDDFFIDAPSKSKVKTIFINNLNEINLHQIFNLK